MSILSRESHSASQPSVDWEAYRAAYFPIARKLRYFDHAAVSPLCQPAHDAIRNWLTEATECGDTVWPDWARRLEGIRQTAAELVNAQVSEIGFVPSTTFGISIVSEGIPWQRGDNVVLPSGEFPSNLFPWKHLADRGVELRIVETGKQGELKPEQIDQACDRKTRLVACSWVGYATGYRICPRQLAEIAHAHGAYFFLDAIQGLGVFPLDVRESGVDFFSADGHKWLMGPEGAGLFFCRHELLDELRPCVVGWNSVQNSYDFGKSELRFKESASRFEAGTQNMAGLLGMEASLDLIVRTGVTASQSPVGERVIELTRSYGEKLEKIGFRSHCSTETAHRSGILSVSKPGTDPAAVRAHLLQRGAVTSVRKNLLRFSPHAYNNEQDIELTIESLRDL